MDRVDRVGDVCRAVGLGGVSTAEAVSLRSRRATL